MNICSHFHLIRSLFHLLSALYSSQNLHKSKPVRKGYLLDEVHYMVTWYTCIYLNSSQHLNKGLKQFRGNIQTSHPFIVNYQTIRTQSALSEVVQDDMHVICSAKDGDTSQSRNAAKVTEHKNNEMALSVKWEDITDFKPSSVVLTDVVQTIHQNHGNPDESYSKNGDSQKSKLDKISNPNFVETVPEPQFMHRLSKIECFPAPGIKIPVDSLEYTYIADESELHGSYSAIKSEKPNEYVSEADCSSSKAVSEMLTSVGSHNTEGDSADNVLYQCHNCEATFNSRGSLRNHQHMQHSEGKRTWKCKICRQTFNNVSSTNISRHQVMCAELTSTQVQQKACNVCGKTMCIFNHLQNAH